VAVVQLDGIFIGCRATARNVYWLWVNWMESLRVVGQLAGMFTGCRVTGWNVNWL